MPDNKMTLSAKALVECDGCGAFESFYLQEGSDWQQQILVAHANWIIKDGKFLCPRCQTKEPPK